MDNRQLTFKGNFNGKFTEGVLQISKEVPISLMPWIKEQFQYRDSSYKSKLDNPFIEDRKWIENDKFHEVQFKTEELLEAFIGIYEPSKISSFFEKHLIEKNSFDNETILTKIKHVESQYKLVRMWYHKGSFMLRAEKNCSVEELESFLTTAKKATGKSINYDYQECMNKGIKVTKPYRLKHLPSVVESIYREGNFIFPKQRDLNPELNYFSLIQQYNLPTNHLDIIQLKTK